jgi:hypothetical protein
MTVPPSPHLPGPGSRPGQGGRRAASAPKVGFPRKASRGSLAWASRRRQLWRACPQLIWLPLLILLVVLGVLIRERAYRAVAPPVHDPLGYFQKGHTFWKEIRAGKLTNPLSYEPTYRPPGCVPFFSPRGYDDFRSFLSWSSYSPVAIWLLALWLAFKQRARSLAENASALALCVGLVSLPLFYHYERNSEIDRVWVGQWGLIDGLTAALCALAAACLLRGVRTRSLPITIFGWAVAAYTLFVKPSGLVMMAVVGCIWALELLLEPPDEPLSARLRRFLSRYFVISAATGFVIYALVTFVCFNSEYLSPANLAMGLTGQGILLKLHHEATPTFWEQARSLVPFIRPTLGWHWFIPLLLLFLAGLWRAGISLLAGRIFAPSLRTLVALLILIAGAVWWLKAVGPQVRYYYPFLTVCLVWLLPEIVPLLGRARRALRITVAAACVCPTLILIWLLSADPPPVRAQQWLGVNVSAGAYADVVQAANKLIARVLATEKHIYVFSMGTVADDIFNAVDTVDCLITGRGPALWYYGPLNWRQETGVRYAELQEAKIIFYEKTATPPCAPGSKVTSWDLERATFLAWLDKLSAAHGVQRSKIGATFILTIIDRAKFLEGYRAFAGQYQWRPEFKRNNPELFPGTTASRRCRPPVVTAGDRPADGNGGGRCRAAFAGAKGARARAGRIVSHDASASGGSKEIMS